MKEAVNETGGKAIAPTDAVDDVSDLVTTAQEEVLPVGQTGRPAVMGSAVRFAERDGDLAKRWVFAEHGFGELAVLIVREMPGFDINIERDAEALLAILLVGDTDIGVAEEIGHDLLGFPAPLPEIFAKVQVNGRLSAERLCLAKSVDGEGSRRFAESRSDAGNVEPSNALQLIGPGDAVGRGNSDGAAGAIVDNLGRTLIRAGFHEVDTEAAGPARDVTRINTEAAQFSDTSLGERVVARKNSQVAAFAAELGNGYSNVSFATSPSCDELGGLKEALESGRRQAEHDLAEGGNDGRICIRLGIRHVGWRRSLL